LNSDLTTRFIQNFEKENCFAQNKSESKPVVLGALKASRNPKEQQKTIPEPHPIQPKENDFNRLLNSALSSARKGMEDEAKQRPQKRNAQEMQKFTAKNVNNANNLNKPFPNKNQQQQQQQSDDRGSHRMVRQKVDAPDNSSFPPQATANPFTDPVKYFEQMNEVAQKSGFKNAQEMMSSLAMMNPMAAAQASYPPPHFPQPYHHQPYPSSHPGMYSSSAPPPPAYPHPIMAQQQHPLPPHPSSYHAYPSYEGGYAGRGGRGRGGEGKAGGGRFGRGRGRGESHQSHSSSEGMISEATKVEGVDNKETVVPTPSDPLQDSLPTERDSGAEHSAPNHYPVGGREGRGFYRGGGRQSYFRGGRGAVGGRFSAGHYQTAAPAMSVNSNPFASASTVSTSAGGESTQAQAPTAPLFAIGQSTTATAGRGRGGRNIAAAGGRGGNKVWVRPEPAATAAPEEGNK
jgi:hypothetical protein